MSLPVAIEPGFTTAASAFNTDPTDAGSVLIKQYVSIQLWENWIEARNLWRAAQIVALAAQGTADALRALAEQYGPDLGGYVAADEATDLAWSQTLNATVAASVSSQVESVTASFPVPL